MDGFSRTLWWLFGSSVGAPTRARILASIREEPKNAQQLANELRLDYQTIRHHLRVLSENRLVESTGEHYGTVYSVAPSVEARWGELESIVQRHRKSRE
ncbi:ArsR family transcriptional regulator [mine drainage metagenome]|uniref:ArsR family transcriptional regulator n=1 Tax=mine drainage metagenome TaxID=410659 RepID=T1CSJ3_9ZZZZ